MIYKFNNIIDIVFDNMFSPPSLPLFNPLTHIVLKPNSTKTERWIYYISTGIIVVAYTRIIIDKRKCIDKTNEMDNKIIDNSSCTLFVTDKNFMFNEMDKWDTTSVTDMSYMFNENFKFNKWNTASVTDMSFMFNELYELSNDIEKERQTEIKDFDTTRIM